LEVLIKDLCKERKDALRCTNQQIADDANMSVHTVNSYFSSASKAPSVYTVGPICAALGVSLDKYFGIAQKETSEEASEKLARIVELEQDCRDMKKDIDHKDEIASLQKATIKKLQIAIVILAAVALVYFVRFDVLNPNVGIIRW